MHGGAKRLQIIECLLVMISLYRLRQLIVIYILPQFTEDLLAGSAQHNNFVRRVFIHDFLHHAHHRNEKTRHGIYY